MPSLFMVMLGGRHARANTEVHDVVMAVGDTLKKFILNLNKLGLVRLKDYILMLGLSSQELVLKDRTIKFILQMLLHNQMI